jgi:hypothetical protein
VNNHCGDAHSFEERAVVPLPTEDGRVEKQSLFPAEHHIKN